MLIKQFLEIENVHPIAIPLPDVSNLITSNLYAVGKGPITRIDTGLKSVGTFEFVQGKLAAAGFSLGDIERIIDNCHDIVHRFYCHDIVHKRSLTIE